jgi:hypothetical protein
MASRTRLSFGIAAVVTTLALSGLGCDAGGLILVETNGNNPSPKADPQSTEFVSAGTVAKNDKYVVVYTMGQPTPQSRVTGGERTLNGGVVGATQPK